MQTPLVNLEPADIVNCLLAQRLELQQQIHGIDGTLKLYCSYAIVNYCYGHVLIVLDDYCDAMKAVSENNRQIDREHDKWERELQVIVPYKWLHDSKLVIQTAWRHGDFVGSNGHPWVVTPSF